MIDLNKWVRGLLREYEALAEELVILSTEASTVKSSVRLREVTKRFQMVAIMLAGLGINK